MKEENILGFDKINYVGPENTWDTIKQEVETALLSAPTQIRNNYPLEVQKRIIPVLAKLGVDDLSQYRIGKELSVDAFRGKLTNICLYTYVTCSDSPGVLSFHLYLDKKSKDSEPEKYELRRVTYGAEDGLWELLDRNSQCDGWLTLENGVDALIKNAEEAKVEEETPKVAQRFF